MRRGARQASARSGAEQPSPVHSSGRPRGPCPSLVHSSRPAREPRAVSRSLTREPRATTRVFERGARRAREPCAVIGSLEQALAIRASRAPPPVRSSKRSPCARATHRHRCARASACRVGEPRTATGALERALAVPARGSRQHGHERAHCVRRRRRARGLRAVPSATPRAQRQDGRCATPSRCGDPSHLA
jgi:hypothetical protein